MSPEKIGRYLIKTEIDRGGMSTVYLAQDPNVDREVAIKLLPSEFLHHPSFRERFVREARIVAALEHPAIVPIYDYGEHEGQPYFVMRHMSGGSLADRLRRGPLSVPEAVEILKRIGAALDHAHSKNIIHRDLKPANILFDNEGKAYLGDFGIARLQESGATLTGTVYLGTPAYMSPEQVHATDKLDGRADIYALGVILYESLTGKKPYEAPTPAGLALKHLTDPVPHILESRPDLPANVDQVINRAMAKNPDERYPTASAMTMAISQMALEQRAQAAGVSIGTKRRPAQSAKAKAAAAPAGTAVSQTPAKEKRSLTPWAIGGVAIVAGICVLALVGLYFVNGVFGLFGEETETPTATATVAATETVQLVATDTVRPSATASQTPESEASETATEEAATEIATVTATITEAVQEPTLRPTFTPRPTNTFAPATATNTPLPTSPPTSAPQPTTQSTNTPVSPTPIPPPPGNDTPTPIPAP